MAKKSGYQESKTFKIALIVCTAIFLIAGGIFIFNKTRTKLPTTVAELVDNFDNDKITAEVPEDFPENYNRKFSDMYQINNEVQGVLKVPEAGVALPVVKAGDNHKYSAHNFFNDKSESGTPYLDYRSNLDPTQGNLLIYGPNKNEEGALSFVEDYRDADFARQHPLIEFNKVIGEDSEYKIFSTFMASLNTDDTDIFDYSSFVKSVDKDAFNTVAEDCKSRSLIDFPVDVQYGDEILMLSVDSKDFDKSQFVVVGRKVRESEDIKINVADISQKENPRYPNAWYAAKNIENPFLEKKKIQIEEIPRIDETPEVIKENKGNIIMELPKDNVEPPKSVTPPKKEEKPQQPELPKQEEKKPEPPKVEEKPVEPPKNDDIDANAKEEPSNPTPPTITPEETPSSTPPLSGGKTIQVNDGSGNISGDALDIVSRVVAAEMGPNFPVEALKAQAVATYSYVLYSNNNGSVPYMPMREPTSKIISAVESVLGRYVSYGGSPAFTTYYAMSAGKTNSAAEVWGGSIPYLTSVDSSYDTQVPSFSVKKTYSEDEVRELCESKMDITMQGDPSTWFEVLSYSSGGYNENMRVGGNTTNGKGRTITGRMIREGVLTGLRSAAFDVEYSNGTFTFTTKGYGHGVGMSQWGAYHMANAGQSYEQILAHYFPGTSLV